MTAFANPHVEKAFDSFPENVRPQLLRLRKIVLATAAETEGIGPLDETVKRGLPAYLTNESRSGSTIRIGEVRDRPGYYAVFFNSQLPLVEQFRSQFSGLFEFEGEHAIAFHADDDIPLAAVCSCIRTALTYYLHEEVAV
jgi:hypothetical protein